MSGVLATEMPSLLVHPLQHVAIADRGTFEHDAGLLQRLFEPEVAHQRSHHASRERAADVIVHRDDIEELVAVIQAAFAVGA